MPGVLRWLGAVVAVTGLILVALAIADQQTSLSIETVVAVSHVSPAATDDNGQQKLAIGPDDSLVIAYTAADNGLEQAQLAKSDDNGRSWNHLATLGRPGIWSDLPSLVTGADGAIHAAWVDYETVGHVWYTPLGPDGRISPEKISPGPDYAGFPVLAATPEALHVLWYGARPNADTDHGSLYEISHSVKSDSIWSDPEVISTGSEDALNPTIASGPENTVYGAWFQARSGSYGIEFATYNRQWTPSRLISNDA